MVGFGKVCLYGFLVFLYVGHVKQEVLNLSKQFKNKKEAPMERKITNSKVEIYTETSHNHPSTH